ncbi:hypothetical protein TSUD_259260 [Trifolium subterraneum]|uniref:Protein kinase domain-containing protein n=1 Tax=Trifolium subterraneum TaxID=3900 RepID=A0A2Z6MRD8_TRISU|nr:hypothetical protein TSUD_259260 [Trifolium subterraneum]
MSMPPSDAEALLKFKGSLTNAVSLSSWDPSINPKPPCTANISNWVGLFCLNNRVLGLRLESMGLTGNMELESLSSMPMLRMVSLMNNTFVGPLPNIKMLPHLRSIYLSYNHFSGQIPDDAFTGMPRLRKVYLSNNEFSGKIPSSLAILPTLLVLRLDANKFQGEIPNFHHKNNLKIINFSNNNLEGPIPPTLRTFEASSFRGNPLLCGPPLTNSCQFVNPTMLVMKTLLIVIMIAFIVAIVVSILAISRLRSQKKLNEQHYSTASKFHTQASSKYVKPPPVYVKTKSLAEHYDPRSPKPDQYNHGHSKKEKGEQGKLIFLRTDGLTFDLQDLLRASAEILGSASFGSSYKAVILDGQAVVVVKSALPSVIVPHGHLKSSNILLDESFEPLLTDYALSPLINLDHAQQIIMPYKSPEYAQLGRITKKTDVWSFGILILEILTGKFPENYITSRHNSDSDLASWVNMMITEKRTSDVFDVEMGGVGTSKAELLKLLKIGLSCCEENVERRLEMKEALEQIEDLNEGQTSSSTNTDHHNFGEYSSSLVTTTNTERDAYRAV